MVLAHAVPETRALAPLAPKELPQAPAVGRRDQPKPAFDAGRAPGWRLIRRFRQHRQHPLVLVAVLAAQSGVRSAAAGIAAY